MVNEKLKLDKNKIINLYDAGFSCVVISKIFNCSQISIQKILKKEGIILKMAREYNTGKESFRKIKFSEEQENRIIYLYIKELKSMEEISKEFNVSTNPIRRILKEKEVDTSISTRRKILLNKGRLKVWNKDLTKEDPRVLNNISSEKSISSRFKKGHRSKIKGKTLEEFYGNERAKDIKIKGSKSHKGQIAWNKGKVFLTREKNPRWLGGISFEPYTLDFNKRFKEEIRIRDGFLCIKCGMKEEDQLVIFKRKLSIHHVNYIKKETFPENCCTVCVRCNAEVNTNRPHWTKFFQSLLSERYGYQYTEDGKIILNLREDNLNI